MEIKVIKTQYEYKEALNLIEKLIDKDPDPGTTVARKLELLSLLIADYEEKNFPNETPDPIEAIKFRMEQENLTQRDLVPYIGSRSKVSEILSRKRPLTLPMIRALYAGLGIPLESLMNPQFEEGVIDWNKFPIKEILKRRHFSPTHGLVDYVPCKDKDSLVIDVVPDIIATANQHRAEIDCYNNILMISSSCWQSITPFEEKIGNVPEPCRVPLFNLKTREIKIIDFSGGENNEIKWDESENLTCKLENKNG